MLPTSTLNLRRQERHFHVRPVGHTPSRGGPLAVTGLEEGHPLGLAAMRALRVVGPPKGLHKLPGGALVSASLDPSASFANQGLCTVQPDLPRDAILPRHAVPLTSVSIARMGRFAS
jgi:hypothetical protein